MLTLMKLSIYLGVSDSICSGILCLISVIGIAYNVSHSKILVTVIWYNEALEERTVVKTTHLTFYMVSNKTFVQDMLDLELVENEEPISTISETTEERENPSTNEQQGFFYLRMENPVEIFP